MKKVRVNAQVTFMTSILELFGSVTLVILAVVFKAHTLPTLIHSTIFYHILLPRAFLMNTSHNKDRIIEYGWKNILRNLLGMPKKPPECQVNSTKERIQHTNEPIAQERNQNLPKPQKLFTTSVAPKTTETNVTCSNLMVKSQSKRVGLDSEDGNLRNHDSTIMIVEAMVHQHQDYKIAPKLTSDMVENTEGTKKSNNYLKGHHALQVGYQKDNFFSDLELESDFLFNQSYISNFKKSNGKTKQSKPNVAQLLGQKKKRLPLRIKKVKFGPQTAKKTTAHKKKLVKLGLILKKKKNTTIENKKSKIYPFNSHKNSLPVSKRLKVKFKF
jgi:hypothetical protein